MKWYEPPTRRTTNRRSGKLFHQRSYGVDPTTELLDYDAVVAVGSVLALGLIALKAVMK